MELAAVTRNRANIQRESSAWRIGGGEVGGEGGGRGGEEGEEEEEEDMKEKEEEGKGRRSRKIKRR
jgi:hypothetical protein